MKIAEGWCVVILIAAVFVASGFGYMIGQTNLAADCLSFGAFISPGGHKYECKRIPK